VRAESATNRVDGSKQAKQTDKQIKTHCRSLVLSVVLGLVCLLVSSVQFHVSEDSVIGSCTMLICCTRSHVSAVRHGSIGLSHVEMLSFESPVSRQKFKESSVSKFTSILASNCFVRESRFRKQITSRQCVLLRGTLSLSLSLLERERERAAIACDALYPCVIVPFLTGEQLWSEPNPGRDTG